MSNTERKNEKTVTDTVEKITTQKKDKNPNRVEWGKKLALISAQKKREKKLNLIKKATQEVV